MIFELNKYEKMEKKGERTFIRCHGIFQLLRANELQIFLPARVQFALQNFVLQRHRRFDET